MGYTKLNLTADTFFIGGAQFTNIGTDAINIQDLIVEGAEEGDSIQFFTGTGYQAFTFYDVNFDEDWQEVGPGWTDEDTGTLGTREVLPGEAFWIKTVSDKQIVFAGQCSLAASTTVSCNGAFNLASFPAPVSTSLQNVEFDGIAEGDSVQLLEGTTYHSFTFYNVNFDENWEEVGPGWTDEDTGTLATDPIDLSRGFWLKAEAPSVSISIK